MNIPFDYHDAIACFWSPRDTRRSVYHDNDDADAHEEEDSCRRSVCPLIHIYIYLSIIDIEIEPARKMKYVGMLETMIIMIMEDLLTNIPNFQRHPWHDTRDVPWKRHVLEAHLKRGFGAGPRST
jgi:hypothetical protein